MTVRMVDCSTHEEVAPSIETDQPCTRNGGRSELGIVVELQCVVCNFFNAQMVEQIRVGMRLVVKCGTLGIGRVQISKTRRRNPVELAVQCRILLNILLSVQVSMQA